MRILKRYWQIWLMLAINAVQETFVNRGSNALFMIGKVFRFGMTLVFLLLLKENTQQFGQYTTDQAILFFVTYNIIDVSSQVLFRGVYVFSRHIREGSFDFMLIKPVNVLFQSLMGKPDINDALFLIPSIGVSIWLVSTLELTFSMVGILGYALLLLNGLLIAMALHICVLSLAMLITEVNNVVWLYRDLSSLGRFPVTIYLPLLRFVLFFVIPVGVMITIPAEVLLGLEPSISLIGAGAIGFGSLGLSLWFWQIALKRYSSASS